MRDPLNTPEMREMDGRLNGYVTRRMRFRAGAAYLRTTISLVVECVLVALLALVALQQVAQFVRLLSVVMGAVLLVAIIRDTWRGRW